MKKAGLTPEQLNVIAVLLSRGADLRFKNTHDHIGNVFENIPAGDGHKVLRIDRNNRSLALLCPITYPPGAVLHPGTITHSEMFQALDTVHFSDLFVVHQERLGMKAALKRYENEPPR